MRRQLPVHSPITPGALLAGVAGALSSHPSRSTELLVRTKWPASAVLLTDSGTSALTLGMKAAAGRNTLIALPAFGCYDLATAADGADVQVVLYDVDPETLTPEPESLARALSRRPGAVVAVHLYGIPVDIPALQRASDAVGAVVIEDAAQAFGTLTTGIPAGTLGTFGVLSFGRGKGLCAGGGGALLALDARAAVQLIDVSAELHRAARGWDEWFHATAQWVLARPALYQVPANMPGLRLGETIYHEHQPPRPLARAARKMLERNYRRSEIEAAVRRSHAERLRGAVEASRHCRPIRVMRGAKPGYLRFPVLVDIEHRAPFDTSAAKRLGIMPSYPKPLSRLSGFLRRCINADQRFPGAEQLARNLVTLPTHSLLAERDLRRLEEWLATH